MQHWWKTPLLIVLDRELVTHSFDDKSFIRNLGALIGGREYSLIEVPVHASIREEVLKCIGKYAIDEESQRGNHKIFAQSKNDSSVYIEFPVDDEKLIQTLDDFLNLCQLLGATRAEAKLIRTEARASESQSSSQSSARVENFMAEVHAGVGMEQQSAFDEKFRSFEEHGADFEGGAADLPGAKELLTNSALGRYKVMWNIYDMVESGEVNRTKRIHKLVDLSWERSQTSYAAAKVEASIKILDSLASKTGIEIKAEDLIKSKTHSSQGYMRDITIEFTGYKAPDK